MKAFATGTTAAVQHARSREGEYATADEFCEIFSKNTESLYTLALALTADESKAEECFVSALQECQTASIFKQWAHSWSRLAVIESAIRMVRPTWSDAPVELAAGKDEAAQGADPFAAQVLRLAPFERFAFVLSLLDRYSVRDCAILLKCRPREIQRARQRAIEFLSTNLSDSVRPGDARLIA